MELLKSNKRLFRVSIDEALAEATALGQPANRKPEDIFNARCGGGFGKGLHGLID